MNETVSTPALAEQEAPRSSRSGREAWLALGIGVALCAILLGASIPLRNSRLFDEALKCIDVGLSALIACSLWSIWLCVRALRQGERQTPPVALLVLLFSVGVAIAGSFVAKEGLLRDWYVPAMLVLIAFTGLTGESLLLYLLRRRQLKLAKRGELGMTRRQRWLYALKWGVRYALLCSFTLGVVMVYTQAIYLGRQGEWITTNTPNVFRDAYESVVYSSDELLRPLGRDIIKRGLVSDERLETRLYSDAISDEAMETLARRSPRRLADLAERVQDGEAPPVKSIPSHNSYYISLWIGAYGTNFQRRAYLERVKKDKNPQPLQVFFYNLSYGNNLLEFQPEFLALYQRFSKGDVSKQYPIFILLIKTEPAETRPALIQKLLSESSPEFAAYFAQRYAGHDANTSFQILWTMLTSRNKEHRTLVLENRSLASQREIQNVVSDKEFHQKMSEFLASDDVELKRLAAAQLLSEFGRQAIKVLSPEEERLRKLYRGAGKVLTFRNLSADDGEEGVFESLRKRLKETVGGK